MHVSKKDFFPGLVWDDSDFRQNLSGALRE